jgi:hypothetical protein
MSAADLTTDHPEQEAEHEVSTPETLLAAYLAAPLEEFECLRCL